MNETPLAPAQQLRLVMLQYVLRKQDAGIEAMKTAQMLYEFVSSGGIPAEPVVEDDVLPNQTLLHNGSTVSNMQVQGNMAEHPVADAIRERLAISKAKLAEDMSKLNGKGRDKGDGL